MAILITGATGFVISNLTRYLAENGHEVVAADLKEPDEPLRRYLTGLPGAVTFRRVDVADRQAVRGLIREVRPERTVHGAAITSVPLETEQTRFLETVQVNVMGTLHMLEALREEGTGGRVVVVSSGSIYGPRPDLRPISEDDPGNPQGLYPISKWAAESFARRYAEVHGLDLGVVRLCSPFGPFERDTGSRPLLSSVQQWATAALRGETVRLLGPADLPRDVAYAPDVGSGIAAVLLAERLPHVVYNVGWGRVATADETLAALTRVIPDMKVERSPEAQSPWVSTSNVVRGPLANDRLRALGWSPRYDLDSGLAAYVDWLQQVPANAQG